MTFRRATTLSDTAAASQLAAEVFDEIVAPQFEPEGVLEFHRFSSLEAITARHTQGYLTILAESDGLPAGVIHLSQAGHLALLFVRPAHQRCGIARHLLSAALAALPDPPVILTVNASPNAVPAYERLGFTPTGPDQWLRGIHFFPMQKHLVP